MTPDNKITQISPGAFICNDLKVVVGDGFEPSIRKQLDNMRFYWGFNTFKHD